MQVPSLLPLTLSSQIITPHFPLSPLVKIPGVCGIRFAIRLEGVGITRPMLPPLSFSLLRQDVGTASNVPDTGT